MTTLLHISASPRGERSESLAIAATFLDELRSAHPDVTVEHWDLWDGTLPAFGPPAAAAKMAIFGGAATNSALISATAAAMASAASASTGLLRTALRRGPRLPARFSHWVRSALPREPAARQAARIFRGISKGGLDQPSLSRAALTSSAPSASPWVAAVPALVGAP